MILHRPIERLRRFGRGDDGATAIEFAMIAPVLLLLVMGCVEGGLMVAAQQSLEDAVFMGARTGKTGYVAAGKTQTETVTEAIKRGAGPLLDISELKVTTKAYSDYSSIKPEPFTDTNKNGVRDGGEAYTDVNENGKYDDGSSATGLGASGQVVVFTATYPWPLHTPLIGNLIGTKGYYTLSAQAVVKNEPY